MPRELSDKEIMEKLLNFQYEGLGYGKFRCRSCGSLKHVDYGDQDQPRTESMEECSENCPWRIAREAIQNEPR